MHILDTNTVFRHAGVHNANPVIGKGGDVIMAFVKVDDNEPLEKSIKRFKRMVEKEGIIREWKKREYFEKPSTILNRKKKALARKQMKKVRKLHVSKGY